MADAQTVIRRQINASAAKVFDAVAHIENFKVAVPHITDVEFLSEQKRGVGTRFRETRIMGKREAQTTLEVTEYVENESIRLVSDEGNTIWDTVFRVSALPGDAPLTQLEMTMDVRPYKLSSKLMTKMIMGFVNKAIEADMDMLKAYCEK